MRRGASNVYLFFDAVHLEGLDEFSPEVVSRVRLVKPDRGQLGYTVARINAYLMKSSVTCWSMAPDTQCAVTPRKDMKLGLVQPSTHRWIFPGRDWIPR